MGKINIILIVYIDSHFSELLRVARLLKTTSIFCPVMIFIYEYLEIRRDQGVCKQEGILFLHPKMVQKHIEHHLPLFVNRLVSRTKKKNKQEPHLNRRERISLFLNQQKKKIKTNIFVGIILILPVIVLIGLSNLVFWFWDISLRKILVPLLAIWNIVTYTLYLMFQYRAITFAFRDLITRYNARLVLLAEDNVSYGTSSVIRAAHQCNIPSMLVPFTVANALEAAETYWDMPDYQLGENISSRLVGRLFPRWVYLHQGRKLLRLPPYFILAQEFLHLAPPIPWILYSGFADAIAVESDFMHEYYRQNGLPEKQLEVVGALYEDVLAENLRNSEGLREKILGELDLDTNKPILVCAFPPDQYPRDNEFDTYEELARFWVSTLGKVSAWNVIIRLHPRVRTETMRYLEEYGIRICERDTAQLVPLCDLYVASVSATIRWAIACGIPVVNYDVYQYHYDDYSEAKGVITLFDKESFGNEIRQLTNDSRYYSRIKKCQMSDRERWGKLDGKSGERMISLMKRLISNYQRNNA